MKPDAAWRGSAYPGIINRRLFTNGSNREIWNENEHYYTLATSLGLFPEDDMNPKYEHI